MARTFSWFLALRYLRARWINLLGMVGVALAIWALIVVVAVFSGFISGIRENIQGATAELLVTNLPAETSFEDVDATLRTTHDAEIEATSPRLRHFALYFLRDSRYRLRQRADALPSNPLQLQYLQLIGIDSAREIETTEMRTWLDIGGSEDARYTVANPDEPLAVDRAAFARNSFQGGGELRLPPGILIGVDRTDGMDVAQEISIVSIQRIPASEGGRPVQTLRRIFALSGAFDSRHRGLDHTAAFVDIEEIRTMLGHDIHDPMSVDLVSDVAIRTKPSDTSLQTTAAAMQDSLRQHQRFQDVEVLTWEQQNSLFLGAVDQERAMMKLVLFTVILVSAFLIYATMHMMVTQKIKDIGILSSMGASRFGVRNVFMLCGLTIAVVGSVLGTTIGCLTATYLTEIDTHFIQGPVASAINAVYGWFGAKPVEISLFPTQLFDLDRIPTDIEPSWVLQVSVGAFFFTLLAAYLPARRAARFEPVRALGYE